MGSAEALQRTDNRGNETQKVCWVTFLLKQLFKHFSENERCRRIDNLLLLANNCWTLGVQHLTACFYITTEEATTQTKTQVGNLTNANGDVTWKYNFILFVLLPSTFLKPRTTHSHRNQIVMSRVLTFSTKPWIFGHCTCLFCRGRQRNVPNLKRTCRAIVFAH